MPQPPDDRTTPHANEALAQIEVEPSSTSTAQSQRVTFAEAVRVWVRVALLSFGGPAGQIAVMHRILVEEKRWISEHRFLFALNYCTLLPGPEAQQLATYIGWLLHGTRGGLVAGTLFVLPGFLCILVLSILYAEYRDLGYVQALFFGLKPAVIAVVIEAVVRIGRRALRNKLMAWLAALAFVGIFVFQVPFPWIVLSAFVFGYFGSRFRPQWFLATASHAPGQEKHASEAAGGVVHEAHFTSVTPTVGRAARVAAVWSALWFAPVALLWWATGQNSVYTTEALFFSKTAVVTFGGAYAVLAYIQQECVNTYAWLLPGEMLDGLGMAETTPGPLIMVVAFVAFMGAYHDPGSLPPILAGAIGAGIATWVTFVPCFLWIFLGAPYVEQLRDRRSLSAGLAAITAAVVGVILNLSVWFALYTLFARVDERHVLGARLLVPDWRSLDLVTALLAVLALVALMRLKIGLLWTLALSTCLGLVYFRFLRG